MITPGVAERMREQLLRVLAEDAHNTQRLLGRLDALTEETGIGAHAALLMILTRLPFDDAEARSHWEAILARRDAMAASLGRDVGVRVAALDYFLNVNRRLVQPALIDIEMLEAAEDARQSDPLTGLAGDRSFRATVQREVRRAKRNRKNLALILFDLDGFRAVNRSAGELVADRLLKEASMLLHNKVRDVDLAARPGEDELALVLPETDRNGALLVAERFRRAVEEHFGRREVGGRALELTVSAGVACYPEDAAAPESLVEHAAVALYQAKALGKNQVHVYRPERRRFVRFDLDPQRFEVEVLAPKELGRARPRNLSRSGILFTSPEILDVGERIEIRVIEVAGARPARLRGQVVRLEELPAADAAENGSIEAEGERYEIGVAFDADSGAADQELFAFLERVQGPQGRRR